LSGVVKITGFWGVMHCRLVEMCCTILKDRKENKVWEKWYRCTETEIHPETLVTIYQTDSVTIESPP
jgi:hypothetical protein